MVHKTKAEQRLANYRTKRNSSKKHSVTKWEKFLIKRAKESRQQNNV